MITAILLAAGQSKRMFDENKLKKKYKGVPLIKYAVKNILNSSIEELIIVLGYQNKEIEKVIDKNSKIKFVYNWNFNEGMSSSIKTGLNELSNDTKAFFICLGDMPNISEKIYNQLIIEMSKNKNKKIFVPYHKDKQANPVLFSIEMKSKIEKLEGDFGAKKIIDYYQKKVFKLTTKDKGVITDFNELKDFQSK